MSTASKATAAVAAAAVVAAGAAIARMHTSSAAPEHAPQIRMRKANSSLPDEKLRATDLEYATASRLYAKLNALFPPIDARWDYIQYAMTNHSGSSAHATLAEIKAGRHQFAWSLCRFMRAHHIHLIGSSVVEAALGPNAGFSSRDLDLAAPDDAIALLLSLYFQSRGYVAVLTNLESVPYTRETFIRLKHAHLPQIDIVCAPNDEEESKWAPLAFQANRFDGLRVKIAHPDELTHRMTKCVKFNSFNPENDFWMISKWKARGFDVRMTADQLHQRAKVAASLNVLDSCSPPW
jgi:hypothetical protein